MIQNVDELLLDDFLAGEPNEPFWDNLQLMKINNEVIENIEEIEKESFKAGVTACIELISQLRERGAI